MSFHTFIAQPCHRSNVNASETLANVDAILFLPATGCLHQNACGETVHLAVELRSRENCTAFSSSLGSPCNSAHAILQAGGTAVPSLAQDLLAAVQSGKKVSGETLDYDDVKHICGALYGGTRSHPTSTNACTHQSHTPTAQLSIVMPIGASDTVGDSAGLEPVGLKAFFPYPYRVHPYSNHFSSP